MRKQKLIILCLLSLFVLSILLPNVSATLVTVYCSDSCETTTQFPHTGDVSITTDSTYKAEGSKSVLFNLTANMTHYNCVFNDTLIDTFPTNMTTVLSAWIRLPIDISHSAGTYISLTLVNPINNNFMTFGIINDITAHGPSWNFWEFRTVVNGVGGSSSALDQTYTLGDWVWMEAIWVTGGGVSFYVNGTSLHSYSGFNVQLYGSGGTPYLQGALDINPFYGSRVDANFDYIRIASDVQFPPTVGVSTASSGVYPLDYYFRSDTYETLGVSAYGLDNDYTNTYLTSNVTFPLVYGFRVWLVSSSIVSEELTNSTQNAYIYLNGTESYDSYSSTWLCPETTVNLGYQALKVTVYASDDLEEWTALASYISNVLITKQIETSTWTFTLQVAFDGGNAVYSWGDSSHRSGVSGIIFTEPLESEIQLWRINTGDYVGFILGAYIDVIGEAFYVLCLIGVAGVFYFRYRNFGVIVFFFGIFGGAGGIVWFLVPAWAAAVTSALIIIGTSFIVWRVIR